MTPTGPPADEIVWCPGCEYEAPLEDLPLGSATFGTCPKCQHELHSLPSNATEEYRELLRRF
jgi:uncharacterized paraquat-inducible protein A